MPDFLPRICADDADQKKKKSDPRHPRETVAKTICVICG
jgi:hypothetical protein